MSGEQPERSRSERSSVWRKVGPRGLASVILRAVLAGEGKVREKLASQLPEANLAPRDAGLVTELCYGVVRRKRTLDTILSHLSSRPLDQIEDDILTQLRMGAYQLIYMASPAHAAVNESVAALSNEGSRGFVNAILRRLVRAMDRRTEEEPADVPRPRLLPLGEGWLVFKESVLPAKPDSWRAATLGLPKSLVKRLEAQLGPSEADRVAALFNRTPVQGLRVNLLRTTRPALIAKLAESGIEAEPDEDPEGLIVRSGGHLAGHPAFAAGEFTIQDRTARGVARFVDPQPGERILDLCAAPGGKSGHLAELSGDQATIIAADSHAGRLQRVGAVIHRLALTSISIQTLDSVFADEEDFDRVLVDVPCSNTGVVRRRVELRHRLPSLDRAELGATQLEILENGFSLVKPGGVLIYSTCSIDREENEDRVAAFVASSPDAVLEEERLTLPDETCDGGYVARIRRSAEAEPGGPMAAEDREALGG